MDIGKPKRDILSNTVWRQTGSKSREVIVGPTFGIDVSVLRLVDNRVMVANVDPISLMPELGPKDSAALSVQEVASDVATSSRPPRYALFDLNLPPQVSNQELEEYWKSISRTCSQLGISIIGGHTGRFEGCDYSIAGSATMWTMCNRDEYLTSAMARDRDDVILTKSAAYGATAVLTRAFPNMVRRFLGPSLYDAAYNYFDSMGTVENSLTACRVGIHDKGVSAIHDVTEGGIFSAIYEMTSASGVGCVIDIENIPVSDETQLICKLFHFDAMRSLGEGSLLIACRPEKTYKVLNKLHSRNVHASVIGHMSSKVRGVRGFTKKGSAKIEYPDRDPYWQAYWRASRKRWT